MSECTPYCSASDADPLETVAYNDPLFPAYVRYSALSSYPGYSSISHWHKDLEFVLVVKGAMTYNVNGSLIVLSEGNGIMVNSRQLHYGFSAEHRECEFICILISPELLQGNAWFYQHCIERIVENPAHPYLYLDQNSWERSILKRLEDIHASFQDASSRPLAYFDLIADLLFILKELYDHLDLARPADTGRSSELTALRSMIAYIEGHYAQHITLADIALSGACCRTRCGMLFKKYLHDTPLSYTTKLRLKKSLSALLGSDESITDIAYGYGFGGASYYCETFRRYYGTSPTRFRKNACSHPDSFGTG